jgi:hypothetical protein
MTTHKVATQRHVATNKTIFMAAMIPTLGRIGSASVAPGFSPATHVGGQEHRFRKQKKLGAGLDKARLNRAIDGAAESAVGLRRELY